MHFPLFFGHNARDAYVFMGKMLPSVRPWSERPSDWPPHRLSDGPSTEVGISLDNEYPMRMRACSATVPFRGRVAWWSSRRICYVST